MPLQGSIVALVTPMLNEHQIDWQAVEQLVAWHLSEGSDGLLIGGSTGESATLAPSEKLELFKHIAEIVNGRVPLLVGTGSNNTAASVAFTKAAYDHGVEYSLLTTPYYNKPTQRGLFEHFRVISQEVPDMKHVLYNVPSRTACVLDVLTIAELSQYPNIIGLKDSSTNLERLGQLRQQCRERFSLLSGDDDITPDWVLAGGDGVISVTANVCPRLMHQMVSAALAKDHTLVSHLNQKLSHLHAELFCQSNPIPVKWLLAKLGKIQPNIRLPLTWLEPEFESRVWEAYQTSCQ